MARARKNAGDLPDRIGRLLAAGASMEGIADRLGCSVATLYRWRSGQAPHRSMARMFDIVEAQMKAAKAAADA